jgi:hypothetical protein
MIELEGEVSQGPRYRLRHPQASTVSSSAIVLDNFWQHPNLIKE